jgi:uncharacterized protein YndB with AHSA1/START domain
MKKEINHKLFFEQAPNEVWEYLTRPELMELWLMKSDFQPIVGHSFQFRSDPYPPIEFDGIVYCTVLEVLPFEKLSYSWKCGPGNGKITIDSIVNWTLVPKDKGTELQLEHSAFKTMENMLIFNAMDHGWKQNIHKISELINQPQNGNDA